MLAYSSPLFFLFFSYIVCLYKKSALSNAFTLIMVLFFVVFCGFRWYCGADYGEYAFIYSLTPPLNELTISTLTNLYGEAGYLIFTSIFRYLSIDFAWVALTFSAISITGKLYFAEKTSGLGHLSLILYLLLSFIIVEFIQIRWSISITFILIGYLFFFEKRKGFALLFLSLAVAFHYYALLFVALLPLIAISSIKKAYTIFFLSFVLAIFFKLTGFTPSLSLETDSYVVSRGTRYLNDPTSSVGFFSFLKCLYFASTLLILQKLNPKIDKDSLSPLLIKASLLLTSASLILSFAPTFYLRAISVADTISVVATIRILNIFFERKFKLTSMLIFSAPLAVWFLIDLSNNINWQRISEYKSWLQLTL